MDRKLHHLKAAMDVSGARLDHEINYGHDAECSYLLTGAAELLGDADLIRRARETAVDLMDHVLAEGMDPEYGGLYYIATAPAGRSTVRRSGGSRRKGSQLALTVTSYG